MFNPQTNDKKYRLMASPLCHNNLSVYFNTLGVLTRLEPVERKARTATVANAENQNYHRQMISRKRPCCQDKWQIVSLQLLVYRRLKIAS